MTSVRQPDLPRPVESVAASPPAEKGWTSPTSFFIKLMEFVNISLPVAADRARR